MSKKATAIIIFLVATIIGIGIYDFYETHERKQVTVRTGFKGEARSNQYYATRLFLKRMGIPAETRTSLQGLEKLPDTDTVLFITTKRTTLSKTRNNKLIEWVKSGGHLITIATKDWQYNGSDNEYDEDESEPDSYTKSPDPLQRYMGVTTGSRAYSSGYIDKDNKENEDEDLEADVEQSVDSLVNSLNGEVETEEKKYTQGIWLDNADKKLKTARIWYRELFVSKKHENHTEKVLLNGDNFILRQTIGDGLITLLSTPDFLLNDELEKADHAEILWYLIHGLHQSTNQPANVWLVHNDEMPNLWSLIWKNFWAFIISLIILLVAWMMMGTQRFGPVIPKQGNHRRSLMEHIISSGYFYWKNDNKQKLVDSSRLALSNRLSRIHPGWAQRSQEEQVKLLADQVSMKPQEIYELLYSNNMDNSDHAESFTQLIKQLEEIRRKI